MRDDISQVVAARRQKRQSTESKGDDQEMELRLESDLGAVTAAFNATKTSAFGLDSRSRNLASTYFDTLGGALRANSNVLRVRKNCRRHIATLKWRTNESNALWRGEREARLPSSDLDIVCLCSDAAATVLGITKGAPLAEQFITRIKRRVRAVDTAHARIEAAFDTGAVIAQDRQRPTTAGAST